jgi:hypothetical protein
MKVGSSGNLNQVYKNGLNKASTGESTESKEISKTESIKEMVDSKSYKININGTAEKMADKLLES